MPALLDVCHSAYQKAFPFFGVFIHMYKNYMEAVLLIHILPILVVKAACMLLDSVKLHSSEIEKYDSQ